MNRSPGLSDFSKSLHAKSNPFNGHFLFIGISWFRKSSFGAASDTVNIVGTGAELLQTQSATIGQTITGRQIVEQPQTSRDGLDLVTLLPGVQTTGRPRTSTINGLPKGAINITLDGVDVQDNLLSSPAH